MIRILFICLLGAGCTAKSGQNLNGENFLDQKSNQLTQTQLNSQERIQKDSWTPSAPPRELTRLEKNYESQIQAPYISRGLKKKIYKSGDKIAIIGAGITGISIAKSLLNKGVPGENIKIYDERNLPGGKARGVYLTDESGKDRPYELGAAVIIPGRYKLIEELIAKHGLSTRPLDQPQFFNVVNGEVLKSPNEEEILKLRQQAGYFFGLFKKNPSWLSIARPDGYRNIPANLEGVSWNEFMAEHGKNMDKLNERLAVALGGSGFLMSQNPPFAAQIIRFLNPAFLGPILNPETGSRMFNELGEPCLKDNKFVSKTKVGGFQCLWIREAEELSSKYKVQFEFGVRVANIQRGNQVVLKLMKQTKAVDEANEQIGDTQVSFEDYGSKSFDHAFYTGDFRYLTSSPWLDKAHPDAAKGILGEALKSETELYNSIEVYPYKSYLVRVKKFPVNTTEGFFALMPQIIAGEKNRAVLMMRTYKDSDIYQLWGYGDRSHESTDEFLQTFAEDMKKMGAEFDIEKDIIMTSDWDYFPHATPRSGKNLKEFFNNAMARQGMGGLWLSGEVLGFGLTIESFEQGKAFGEWFVDGLL